MPRPDADSSLHSHMKHYSLLTIFLIAGMLVGYLLTSEKAFFLGLLLGYSVSYFNLWTTYRNARNLGRTTSNSLSMLSIGLGYVFRMLLVLIAVGIALLYPETFHLLAVIIGVGLFYTVMMVDMLIKAYRRKR